MVCSQVNMVCYQEASGTHSAQRAARGKHHILADPPADKSMGGKSVAAAATRSKSNCNRTNTQLQLQIERYEELSNPYTVQRYNLVQAVEQTAAQVSRIEAMLFPAKQAQADACKALREFDLEFGGSSDANEHASVKPNVYAGDLNSDDDCVQSSEDCDPPWWSGDGDPWTDLPDGFAVPVYKDKKLVGFQYQQNGPVEPLIPDRGPPPASVRNKRRCTMRKNCKPVLPSVSDADCPDLVARITAPPADRAEK